MPFVEINVKNEIEKQKQNDPEFRKAWEGSRAEYRLIGEMISLRKQEKITQKAISLGAEYYVVKPFDIEVLINRIRDIKNYKPTPTSNLDNCYTSREIKSQYIEINEMDKKNQEN